MKGIVSMVRKMNAKEAQKFLEPQFGFFGKSNGEQLWMHHYTVWNVFKKFVAYIPSIDEKEREFIEVACLLHDIAKRSEKNQRILRGEEEGKVVHKPGLDEVRDYLKLVESSLPFPPTEENIKIVFDIIVTHHSISEEDLRWITTDSAGVLTELLRYADWLASMESIFPRTINEIRKATKGLFDLTYFEIARFPTPTTYLFLDETIKKYREKGWKTLLVFDNGVVFIGERCEMPQKDEIVNKIQNTFFSGFLESQDAYPKNPARRFLSGASELFPAKFLAVKRDKVEYNLGDIDRKSTQFLKTLQDLFRLNKSLEKLKKESAWELVSPCLSSSGGTKVKTILWEKWFEEAAPEHIDSRARSALFERLKVKEIVPVLYLKESDFGDIYLAKMKAEDLYEILFEIAREVEEKVSDIKSLEDYMDDIISIEERRDFKDIVNKIFERYKTYKEKSDAVKGICEICGCPISIPIRSQLNFPEGKSKGFSQIKAKTTAERAICLFCAYDNIILRKDLGRNNLRIYVRIESKIPELMKMYPALDRLITTLRSGLQYPRDIMKLEEREEFRDLPFPKRVNIPVARKDNGEIEKVISTERGVLFNIERTAIKTFSVKDYRAKYEPLYHILNLLGFNTNIGTEEQVGLFGEAIITTESEYYKSLAVIILANVIGEKGKKQKKYIFAKNLLEQSPSVALRFVSESPKLNEKLVRKFFDFLYKSGIMLFRIKWSEYRMKDLLKGAAFFADRDWGIPHFCVEPMDRGKFWGDLSRHKAAKPVSDALNEMLKGGDEGAFERAVAAFMRNLAKMIPAEEKERQNEFVARSIEILKKFWELRKEDISEFIRAKNALTSTIFVFTRYENLKEVIKNE